MKLELKENMYVRTKDGYISQYKYYDYDIGEGLIGKLLCIPLSNGTFANIEDIVKASYNIIHLIEVGDIISFYEDIDNYKKQYVIGIPDLITLDEIKDKITNDNIRLVSVLTKEQMEQMAYKVEE